MFEYDGIKYCNAEKTQHVGSCKVDKEYTIYVDKKNNNSFVSIKVLVDMMFFILNYSQADKMLKITKPCSSSF